MTQRVIRMDCMLSIRHFIPAIAGIALLASGPIGAQQAPDLAPYLIADRATEIALARTAAPKYISDSATILVITRSGFTEASRGTNGFTCFVLRSFDAAIGDPNFWNPKVRAPHCLNPQAVKTILPEISKRVEWIMTGVSTTEIAARTKRAYETHEFPMPAVGAMTYMTSHEQYLDDKEPHAWMPHLMFYYDKSIPSESWGAIRGSQTVIDGSAGDPASPFTTLFIPVAKWSDGSPALGH
jgi:hypothetical protein